MDVLLVSSQGVRIMKGIKGRKAYNNGETVIYLTDGEEIPNGYVRGGLSKRTPEQIKIIAEKSGLTQQQSWKNKSEDEKRLWSEKCKNAQLNLSEETKRHKQQSLTETLSKRTEEESNVIKQKIGSASKRMWDNLSEEERSARAKHVVECGGGWNKETIKTTVQSNYGVENISQLQETKDKVRTKAQQSFQAIIDRIPYDDLVQYYEIENHSYKQTIEHFNVSSSSFAKLLRHYNFHKSSEHRVEWIKRAKEERYGDANYNNRDKASVTCLEKYGVENPFQDVGNIKRAMTEKYGADHPMKVDSIKQRAVENHDYKESTQKGRETYFQKTGYTNPSKNPQVIQKIQYTFENKYGGHIASIPEIAQKKSLHRNNIISEDGTSFDSGWEKSVYEYCVRNNIPIERNIPIDFEFDGKKHTLLIDFNIDGILVEVKGKHLLEGCFDYNKTIKIDTKLEVYKNNNVVIVTDDRELFTHDKKMGWRDNPKSLIGVDISLFTNPQFPYSSNKPKCYYDVRVSNQKSCYEAFNDEIIRWKMIKNRIKYMGGFIDNKQILTALNVTRTCRQPSWFSKSFAKDIITKYITTDTVVDPFAGWGTRYDACIELGKIYIGCDINAELVKWHTSVGRNISCCDANNFTYDKECSVFICPPYQDTEIYFDGQDTQKTQCQWLEIVMKNIPNAKEYVMVCKTIDKGWEKYIVDTKENKSHFGTNYEYIIKITK